MNTVMVTAKSVRSDLAGIPTRSTSHYVLTNERTNPRITHVTNKSSLSETCTRVQKFRFVRVDETRPLTRRELGAIA